jgi:hypothetical protein
METRTQSIYPTNLLTADLMKSSILEDFVKASYAKESDLNWRGSQNEPPTKANL